mmetsp:Transcript_76086/g.126815  ORF Transcript_76086/g.126815 Transcript_76086/m.126815 type:complete len:330 (-) Transcript_76086:174-1163(-)
MSKVFARHPQLAEQRWAHSVCSRAKLKRALANENVTAIEADILMARSVPVMAHPPAKDSDLDFAQFLDSCIADGQRHIKLDFKVSTAVESCLSLVAARASELARNGQAVWLNADVIPGPNSRQSGATVPAQLFVPLCQRLCPFAQLSLGWRVSPIGPEEAYTPDDALEMERVCSEYGIGGSEVVFCAAVRLAEMGLAPLMTLLRRMPDSQLLLWTGTGEAPVRERTLKHIRSALAAAGLLQRVGFDVMLARTCAQHAQAHCIDSAFFCSRWGRWLCCVNRPRIGERQPLVRHSGVRSLKTPDGAHSNVPNKHVPDYHSQMVPSMSAYRV